MKIDDLIDELNKFKEEYGNVEVGVPRLNTPYEDLTYYADIKIFIVENDYLHDNCRGSSIVEMEPFCVLG